MTAFRVTTALGLVLRSLFYNIGPAIRMTWPWMAIYAVVQAVVVVSFPATAAILSGRNPDLQETSFSTWIAFMFLMGVSCVAFSSAAVNWHRFILLGEEAAGAERLRLDGTVFRYLGNLFLSILIVVPVFAVTLVVAVLAAVPAVTCCFPTSDPLNVAAPSLVIGSIAALVPLVVMQRLVVKLPAIALVRRDYTFGNAWRDSSGHNLRLAGFVAMIMVVTFGIGWFANMPLNRMSIALGSQSPIGLAMGAFWQVVINCIGWVISINAITILYGIFAGGREI